MKMSKLLMVLLCFAIPLMSLAQAQRTIRGTIRVEDNKETVIGANVIIKGTNIGTTTDIDGKFQLDNVPANAVLQISMISFASQEIELNNRTELEVMLKTDAQLLNQVVVIGYGSVRKDDATGSVVAIKAENMNKGLTTSPQEMMSGKIAGLNIQTEGGSPGSGAKIRIRGGASLNASNDPLIVVDGVPLSDGGLKGVSNSLSMINPDDIETFTVLKDASATAIYGSRGSNGVILITTKKGRAGQAPRVAYNGNVSISSRKKEIDVLSADEFRSLMSETFQPGDEALTKMGTAHTNWQDQIFRTAIGTEHNMSVSGGLKNMPYRGSLGYSNQQGIVKTSNFERFTGNANISPSLFDDHLKVNLNLKGTYMKNQYADNAAIASALNMDPTQEVRNNSPYGGYFTWLTTEGKPINEANKNPLAMLEMREKNANANNIIGSAMFDYALHFMPDLHAVLNLAYDYSEGTEKDYTHEDSPMAFNRGGERVEENETKRNQLLEFYFNYDKTIESIHSRFGAMAGYSWQHFYREGDKYNTSVTQDRINEDSNFASENFLVSFFGRFNYTFKERYMLTLTLRNDGSSRFHKNHRWGLFPSMAAGWKIKEESFLKNVKAVSDLKLRLGWGKTGQQSLPNNVDYPYIPRYTYSSTGSDYQFGSNYLRTARPEAYNPKLKWEETTTYNIGLDWGIVNNRINGSVDYYTRQTTDLINEVFVPAGTNFKNKVWSNVGTLNNKGIEVSINIRPIVTSNLTWEIGANFAYNQNKITKLSMSDDKDYLIQTGGIAGNIGSNIQAHAVDQSINSFYVYEQVYDLNSKPLEGIFVDQNLDGIINERDLKIYKDPAADYTFGFSNKIIYKNWDWGFTARANFGNYVYNNTESMFAGLGASDIYKSGYLSNRPSSALDTRFGSTISNLKSDYYVQNASFLKIDNITLGYSFDKLTKAGLSGRIYGTVQNPFVFTKYSGLDPEVKDGIDKEIYPRPLICIIGLSLIF